MSNSLGRINLDGHAVGFDRSNVANPRRRFQFKAEEDKPSLPTKVCPGCNLRRTPREFQSLDDQPFENCSICRGRNPDLR